MFQRLFARPAHVPGSRTTFNTHLLLNNIGSEITTDECITCESLKRLLPPNTYDLDFICGELETVKPVPVNKLFLHDASYGLLSVINTNADTTDKEFVVSIRI